MDSTRQPGAVRRDGRAAAIDVMPDDTRVPRVARLTVPRARRAWRVLAICAATFAILVALAFFAAPPLIRPALEQRLSAALARKVSIGEVAINPFALSTTLRNVVVGDRDGGPDLLHLDELYVNAEASSLFRWAPVVSAIHVVRPAVHLVRGNDGRYNVSDLVDAAMSAPPGPTPRFSLSNIRVDDGRIDFDDRPERQTHEVTGITLGIPFLSSLPVHADIEVAPTLAARINGRPIDVTGETRPFKDTHETRLHWDVSGLPIARYLEYVPGDVPVRVPSGTLDARVDLTYVGRGKEPPQVSLAGTLHLAGVAVNDASGAPLARVEDASIVVDGFDPLAQTAEVRAIEVAGAEVSLKRGADGALNVAALGSSSPKAAAATAKPLRFHVAKIALSRGAIRFTDEAVTPRYETRLGDVSVDIADLSNQAGRAAKIALAFATAAGERVRHDGTLALAPLAFDGRTEISGLKLGPLLPYYGSALNLAVDDGALDAAADVRYAGTPPQLVVSKLDGALRDLKLRLPDDKQPLWQAPRIAVSGGVIDVARKSVRLESVEGRDIAATIRRDADGTTNFARLLKPAPGGSETEAADTWLVEVQRFALDGLSATYVDRMMQPPATLAVTQIVARGENVGNGPGRKGRIELRAVVNRRGAVTLAGPLSTRPPGGTFQVTAKDIDLVPFQPYASPYMRVVTTGGRVGLRGSLELATRPAASAHYKGDVVITDLATLDEGTLSDLVKWKSLTLHGVDAVSEPLAVAIDDIAGDGVYARLILSEQGRLNLQGLLRSSADPDAATATTPSGGSTDSGGASRDSTASGGTAGRATVAAGADQRGTPWLRLGKASLTGSTLDFTDHFIRPNYSANLTDVSGSMSTLAFDQTADVQLRGSVQGDAPVEINGKVNPLARELFLDLRAEARDIELPPLTPYSAKYVGYGIEKGKLSMKVHYLIEARKLAAENTIVLNQLTFGQRVESPDATKLPVLLAVSLLKDRNGVIDFDLPVGGSLDDPQFSVGGLVWRAIGNLIAKIVTAPFALLGKLAGHGEELAYVEFAPGSAALDGSGVSKVDALAKALNDRPALKLDVAGRVDPVADGDALKRAALDRRIRAQKFADLAKSREPPASVDAVQVGADEYDALLARVYKALDPPKDAAKDASRADMETFVLSRLSIGDEDLRQLAERRADVVRDRLADSGKVPPERVFVVAAKLNTTGIQDKGKPTRVDFALR